MTTHIWRRIESYTFPFLLFVVAWTVMVVQRSGIGVAGIFPILDNFSLLGLVALGVGMTLILGQLDLSAVAVVTLGGILSVHLQGLGLVGALIATALAGGLYGSVQGYLIRLLRIDSVVFTIAASILLGGVAHILAPVGEIVNDPTIGDPLLGRYGAFSVGSIVALCIFGAVGIFLSRTRIGKEVYAVGGSLTDSTAAGVAVTRTFVVSFGISGACSALAGAIAAFQGGSANSTSYTDLLLTAVSAAIIGGVVLGGGRGSVVHIALGVGILGSISAGLAARGEAAYVNQIVTAALLAFVIGGEFIIVRIRRIRLRPPPIHTSGLTN
ncbi:ABC transporter permease [Jatrophihabitans sp. DSM 45814]